MDKINVLFLCTGNSARSQMAEAFLRYYGHKKFEAFSAGIEPQGINPCTEEVMEEIGISLKGHRSKALVEYLGKKHFSYLITVCSDAEEKCPSVFPGISNRLQWYFEDPAAFEGSDEQKLFKFREIRDQINVKIKNWIKELGVS